MKLYRASAFALLTALTVGAWTAQAQNPEGPKTREQVRKELQEAIRTGDIIGNPETGEKLYEMYPGLYPARTVPPCKTRAEVRAELMEAIRTGDMLAPGESMCKLNELAPSLYPPKPEPVCKTREQVIEELKEAVRMGDIMDTEQGCTLRELNPGAYPARR